MKSAQALALAAEVVAVPEGPSTARLCSSRFPPAARSGRSRRPSWRRAPRCARIPSSAATRPAIPCRRTAPWFRPDAERPTIPTRHARPCRGHSRSLLQRRAEAVDGRDKPGSTEIAQWILKVRDVFVPSRTAPRRAQDQALCARQEPRARRRQGPQAVLERIAARPEPAGDRGLSRARRASPGLSRRLGDRAARGDRRAPTGSIPTASSAGPDRTISSTCSRTPISPTATRRSTEHGFLVYPIATLGAGGDAGGRGGKEPHRRCRRDPGLRDASAPRSSSSPIPTIRPAPIFPSTRSSACIARCRRTSCS